MGKGNDVMTNQPIKPSDIAALVICAGMFLLICWALAQAHKRTVKSGNEFTFGCDLMLGFVVLIILGVIAIALMSGFQAMYPGQ
jgi:hypothetical protein